MKTIADLKRDFAAIKEKKIPRTDKMPLVRSVRGGGPTDREGRCDEL